MTANNATTPARAKNVVMASHGRAPWYTPDGKNVDAYVVGIAGGSSSGKTSVARAILQGLDHIPSVMILSQDSFYKYHTEEEIRLAFASELDVDHPDSIDMELFAKCIVDLKKGKATELPVYSFVHHQRMPETKYIYGASVIIVEGILAMQPELRDLYDLKIFVNCDSDLMLARRIKRDTVERGRDVNGILDQYLRFVKSSYDNFVQPSSKYADIIVPGYNNETAIELLITHVKRQLKTRALRFRDDLVVSKSELAQSASWDDEHVVLLEQTNQLRGIMTILRDTETNRGDFIFYIDRLATLIVEKALTLLPHKSKDVVTPTGNLYHGVANCDSEIVGVSILRSGGPFSHGLRRVIRDVPLGSLLIQSDPRTGEPLLLNLNLPQQLRSHTTSEKTQVLLLDSQMGTGAAALMAIRVLLDHGVPERHITFLTFLVSRQAVHTVRRAFPHVRIVTAAIDSRLDEVHLPGSSGKLDAADPEFAARLIAQSDVYDDASEAAATPTEWRNNDAGSAAAEREKDLAAGVNDRLAWVVLPGMGHIGDRYYLN
ncbi:hypothetical protein VHUM_02688 [Vanrija humicola]|uniref:Uridine kinase n=1 Tax=Vanrija humicola TaxID=5417 RepID=A0A7D8UZ38_VANHU|nr:hypothetical protein VHUM_02688 [Vanrija humicola]